MSPTQPPNERDESNDEPLDRRFDRLLEQARWPEPTADQLARLERQWQALSPQRKRSQYLRIAGIAAAASLLIAVGLLAWRSGQVAEGRIAGQQAANPQIANPEIAAPQVAIQPTDDTTPEPTSQLADDNKVSRDAHDG